MTRGMQMTTKVPRRTFLKAMGLTGLLCATNWKTLLKGPSVGDIVETGWKAKKLTMIVVAGTNIPTNTLVTLKSGRVAVPTNPPDPPNGVTQTDARLGDYTEIVIQGTTRIRTR